MKKFWLCKKKVTPFDCAGQLQCYEEKSKCSQVYKAKQPKKLPNKAKSVKNDSILLSSFSFLPFFPYSLSVVLC